jgi:hypothetical protein
MDINYFCMPANPDVTQFLSYHTVNSNNLTSILYTDTSNKNHLILFSYNYTQNYAAILKKIGLVTTLANMNLNYQQRL